MKRNLVFLSVTLLLAQTGAFADAITGGAIHIKTKSGTVPPPPKEALPGNKTMIIPATPPSIRPTASSIVAPESSDAQLVTVGEGGPYTASRAGQLQRFADYLELKKDQENAKLTLSIENKGFQWFRLLIANQVVATEKSLDRNGMGKLDVSGIVQPGSNQVVVQAGGPANAQISWKVTTVATAKLDRVDPDEAIVGDTVSLKGTHFALNPSSNEVTIGSTKAKVTQAKATELKVEIPQNAEPGDKVNVTAKVNGVKTNTITFKLRGIPQVTGTNLQGVPPGQNLTVYGKNFSKNLGENRVFFDQTPAEIMNGSTTELQVIVPFIPYREGHYPSQIKVQVGKVMSKTSVGVQVGPQMFTEPGFEVGPNVPGYQSR
jgi:hypothetical protein